MKIVHVSRSDLMGGAAKAAYRLHRGLTAAGHDSEMLVEDKLSDDPRVMTPPVDRRFSARFARALRTRKVRRDYGKYLRGRPKSARLFSDDRGAMGLDIAAQIAPDAIVTLHWIARFAAFGELLGALGPSRTLVWRLADMNPFTGGCHYDGGCGRFTSSCGECPMLASPGPRDLSNAVWRRKTTALDQLADDGLHLVAVSQEGAEQARASSLLGRFPLSVIPPSVDVEVFRPLDRRLCRQMVGLEPEDRVVLLVASSLDDPVKGGDLVCEALNGVEDPRRLTLFTVGKGPIPTPKHGVRTVHRGYLTDDDATAAAYNCADVVVMPSRQEAFGQVVIEALACGVPVVGFGTGGVRDSVADGVNGFVATESTALGLRGALDRALSDPGALRAMGEACRRTAVDGFAVDVVTRRYVDLYRSLLDHVPGDDERGACLH